MAGEPDLAPGVSSEWVSYLQQMLNHHYQQTVVDENGTFDDATASAVAHFRIQRGLSEGSTVDSRFWGALLGRDGAPAGEARGAEHGSTYRQLTVDEISAAYTVFHDALDTGEVVLSEGGDRAVAGHARTLPDHVTFPAGVLSDPPGEYLTWLVHELSHCWQYQQGAGAPGEVVSELGAGHDYGGEQALRDAAASGRPFAEFGYAEQAAILTDYYRRIGGDTTAFDPYIDSVREGTWQSAPAQP